LRHVMRCKSLFMSDDNETKLNLTFLTNWMTYRLGRPRFFGYLFKICKAPIDCNYKRRKRMILRRRKTDALLERERIEREREREKKNNPKQRKGKKKKKKKKKKTKEQQHVKQ